MTESELLPHWNCQEIFAQVRREARAASVEQVEVMLGAGVEALTRFANNTIHQNVSEQSRYVSVRVVVDHRTARATTNRLDRASIQAVVRDAIAIAKAQEPDPELLPICEPAPIQAAGRYYESTARCSPAERAGKVAEAIAVVEAASQTAAGTYSTEESVLALLNSHGVFAYHAETLAKASITAMATDSSGWAKASSPDCVRVNPAALAAAASRKASLSAAPREIPPGRYTVILEPAAVLDLLGQMFPDFSATAIADQRSFLTGRVEEKLLGGNITIYDDVYHPLQSGAPFDGEGVPRRPLTLVEHGVPRQIPCCRSAAARAGLAPTGHGLPVPNEFGEAALNIVMEGGSSSISEMIASTPRGILVTRLWYIREVDPYDKIMTGMTRDGTFLVENGEVVCGVRNLRFNQSLVEMLRNAVALSSAVRTSGEEAADMVVPAMKVNEFQFTEVTRF